MLGASATYHVGRVIIKLPREQVRVPDELRPQVISPKRAYGRCLRREGLSMPIGRLTSPRAYATQSYYTAMFQHSHLHSIH